MEESSEKVTKKSCRKNPDIWKLAQGHQTGPKTPAGKLKCSVNAVKYKKSALRRSQNSLLSNKAKCTMCPLRSDCDMVDVNDKGCQVRYNAMVDIIKNTPTKQLDEVLEMTDLFAMLKGELSVHYLNMLKTGDWGDLRELRGLIGQGVDTLEKLHKMKHGSKLTVKKEMSYIDVQNQLIKMSKEVEAEVVNEENENDSP